MADDTDITLRSKVLYQVYVRNHSIEGSFRAVEADLDRIKNLGVDIIHLLPVHPVGTKNRKGSLGSPYAISDYRAINPELGTMEDFAGLVKAMHNRGIRCVMDIVYNHTSPDSFLAWRHPEWFYRGPDGGFGSRIGDWWDVADLDYSDPASGLWEYQIETLKIWAKIVDGFRCDVAPLVPLEFWKRAREEVAAVNPRCIWIAESVEPSFIMENRSRGLVCHSDSEMFRAFDACYDYDIFAFYQAYIDGLSSLASYAAKINDQEYTYPANYIKLRNLENHDRDRAAFLIPDEKALRNWTAFNYFQKGLTLIYAGEETVNDFRPGLFDKDAVNWNTGKDLSPLMRAMYKIRQDPLFESSAYHVEALDGDTALAVHRSIRGPAAAPGGGRALAGLFCLKGQPVTAPVPVPDGSYVNRIDGSVFRIGGGRIRLAGNPVIFDTAGQIPL
ncbi:MAG: hypothetical protein LBI67_06995 [Treponema sp.]|jgi:glycosidase|nr:hypothetical protein [Treponema sp.]